MANSPTIELPRLENERAERYQARVEYITAGANRSLEAVSQKLSKSVPLLKRWSSADNWVALAADFDQTTYTLAAQDASNAYRADLEAHRKEAMDSGRVLLQLANGLAKSLADALQQPQKIKGADGNLYTLHKLTPDNSTLTTIGKAYTAALDLRAHALGVDQMMGKLSDDSE